jgi:hypothetical protein
MSTDPVQWNGRVNVFTVNFQLKNEDEKEQESLGSEVGCYSKRLNTCTLFAHFARHSQPLIQSISTLFSAVSSTYLLPIFYLSRTQFNPNQP